MASDNPLTPKERMAISRHAMPQQTPQVRVHNFDEVNFGYSPELAQEEALRCLECKKPLCVTGCPVGVQIPDIIRMVAQGKYEEAALKLSEDNALPAVCGRVCPQENQCEKLCVLGKKHKPVAIGHIERFVADFALGKHQNGVSSQTNPSGFKVAVIGSGPAGLTVAGDLARLGHGVTVFEALHELGGVLLYGIPEFRLPKAILKTEIRHLEKLGVQFEVNVAVGRTFTIDDLFDEENFDAVFIGTGAGLPRFLNIPGEQLNGVYSANEFLTRVNLMKAYAFPEVDSPVHIGKRVAVIGGGNVAMDAARTAMRLGAEVFLVYRRSRDEMPARNEEIEHGEEEGLQFLFLTNPIRLEGDEKGWLRKIVCVQMALGQPDASGRRSSVPIDGSEFELAIDTVIIALGSDTNSLLTSTDRDLKTSARGTIVADSDTGQTSRPGVFAGGDVVTGGATVISAMGAGRRAAKAIDVYLRERTANQ
jgi:glutamate synthase (NADPH/NADH) small chain